MNTRTIPTQPVYRTHALDHRQLLVIADRPGTRIKVLSGGAWLTEEGQPDDRFTEPGQELQLTRPGRAIVEGLGRTRLQLAPPAPGLAQRLAARWRGGRALLPRAFALVLSLAIALALPDLLSRSFGQLAVQGTLAAAAPATLAA